MIEGKVVVGSRAEIARVAVVAHPGVTGLIVAADLGRPVVRSVIAKDELEVVEVLREY